MNTYGKEQAILKSKDVFQFYLDIEVGKIA
jgi:hypothetical protein